MVVLAIATYSEYDIGPGVKDFATAGLKVGGYRKVHTIIPGSHYLAFRTKIGHPTIVIGLTGTHLLPLAVTHREQCNGDIASRTADGDIENMGGNLAHCLASNN
jgi:hypothetical protein